nr:unnamed protein product [Haemonchus contortus]
MLASFLRLYPDQYPSSPGHRLPKEWASHHKMQRKFQWNTAICHKKTTETRLQLSFTELKCTPPRLSVRLEHEGTTGDTLRTTAEEHQRSNWSFTDEDTVDGRY